MSLERRWAQRRLIPGEVARLKPLLVIWLVILRIGAQERRISLRRGLSCDPQGMPVEHHLSRERSCGRDVSLQLPRSALAPLPLSRFAASDTIQTVEIHDRGEETTVERRSRLVKVSASKETDEPFHELCQEHEHEEDKDDGREDQNRIGDPIIGRFVHSELSVSVIPPLTRDYIPVD